MHGIKKAISISYIVLVSSFMFAAESIDMIPIPAGSFIRGLPDGIDNPLQTIFLSSFRMSRYEISFKEYMEYFNTLDSDDTWNSFSKLLAVGKVTKDLDFHIPDEWPIWYVDYFDALLFCNWLSSKDGFCPVYSLIPHRSSMGYGDFEVLWDRTADGYRLPTEAEWEYVARAGGKDLKIISTDSDVVKEIGWFIENSEETLHPRGLKEPNLWGFYDLIGNVAEWCWDYYQPNYYSICSEENPIGPESGFDDTAEIEPERTRTSRGGSFSTLIKWSNAFSRGPVHPGFKTTMGIRVVRSVIPD